jgi:hypothetical protein
VSAKAFRFEKTDGEVVLSGCLDAEAADGWVPIFILPPEYRPGATICCGLLSEHGPLEVWIEPDGSMIADSHRGGWIDFDGTTFRAG